MFLDKYSITGSPESLVFQFTSVGKKGNIEKLVEYSQLEDNLYNLGFGDKMSDGSYSDTARTDNGDTIKVLATVGSTIQGFFEHRPLAAIFVSGITESRNILYGRNVGRFFSGISEFYTIYGKRDGEYLPFSGNTRFEHYLIRKK